MTKGDKLLVRIGSGAVVETMFANEGTCRGCGQAMLWVLTEKGKRMPLDPTPDEHGAYTSHFATCVDVKRFRKP